jgi:hypothetical protein
VFDVGQHGERFFLAIELLEGGTLGDWLATPRSERDVTAMMRAAARGLAAAHACGIVHRDFKPENVLLARDGTPRVSDFGLAASNLAGGEGGDGAAGPDERLTSAGAVMGTPAYMAPEQRDGKPADERADQYSLCLVWLQALGRDRAAPAGESGAARGSSAVIRVLMRGLDPDPARRWPSVAALLDALDAHDRAVRRRRRLLAALAATALLAGAYGLWSRRGGAPEEPIVVGPGTALGPATAEPPLGEPRVLKRHKSGEGQWRMALAGDGTTVVRNNAGRDALWIEEADPPGTAPLPLPPDEKVSRRMDAIPAVSHRAETVLVRITDGSLWVTGRTRETPLLLNQHGDGPACLHPSGDRAVTARIREPIEIRSTADARLLGTGPVADLCTWHGDRIVIGKRMRVTNRIGIVEPDGRVRDLIELPGDLSALAVDERGRILVAHYVRDGEAQGGSVLTALSPDGPPSPVTLRRTLKAGYQYLASTSAGIFLAEVPFSSRIEVAPFDPAHPAAPLALRALDSGTSNDGSPLWLDDDRVLFHHDGGGMLSMAVGGAPAAIAYPITGQTVGRNGDELYIVRRFARRPGDLRPRCDLVAERLGAPAAPPRRVRSWPCADLVVVRCHEQACAIGEVDGDDVHLRRLDPRDGSRSPPIATAPLGGTPHAAIAPDGRWLIESAGSLTIVDPAAGTRVELALPDWTIDDAVWTPDGHAVFASSTSDDGYTVLHVSLDGVATVLATSPQAQLGPPQISPSGQWLVVQASERLPEYVLLPR